MLATRATPVQHDRQAAQVWCMYSHAHPSQRCDQLIGLHDLEWAAVLWQTLNACSPQSHNFRHILAEYSRLFLCPQHRHEIDLYHKDYWQQRLDAWTDGVRRHLQHPHPVTPPRASRASSRVSSPSPASPTTTRTEASRPPRGTSSAPPSPNPRQLVDAERSARSTRSRGSTVDNDRHRRHQSEPNPQVVATHLSATPGHGPLPRFRLYMPSSPVPADVESTVMSPLTMAESQSGYIYAYRRVSRNPQDQTHVRIGHTVHKLEYDARIWSSQCQYFFQLVCPPVRVRNAARVQALIYQELESDGRRRQDLYCKSHPKRCQTMHDDWFEMSADAIPSVIHHWASWMETYDPYIGNGNLRPDVFENLIRMTTVSGGSRPGSLWRNFTLDSRGRCWQRSNREILISKSPGLHGLADSSKPARVRTRPPIPRRRTSANLRGYTSSPGSPLRETARSQSVACFHTLAKKQSASSVFSLPPGSRIRSLSTPPSTKFLRRTQRHASLRSLVSSPPQPTLEVHEAQVIRRQKCRSIYIAASSQRKISVLQDLSRIRSERG